MGDEPKSKVVAVGDLNNKKICLMAEFNRLPLKKISTKYVRGKEHCFIS
jgi:hypothetical protein